MRRFGRIQTKSNPNQDITNLQVTSYNQLVLPAHLQLSLSNALQIPLGSKFLTDLSTFKRLHFGMLYYHTIFALILILLNLILFSHYLLLNSTNSWKLTFFSFLSSLA